MFTHYKLAVAKVALYFCIYCLCVHANVDKVKMGKKLIGIMFTKEFEATLNRMTTTIEIEAVEKDASKELYQKAKYIFDNYFGIHIGMLNKMLDYIKTKDGKQIDSMFKHVAYCGNSSKPKPEMCRYEGYGEEPIKSMQRNTSKIEDIMNEINYAENFLHCRIFLTFLKKFMIAHPTQFYYNPRKLIPRERESFKALFKLDVDIYLALDICQSMKYVQISKYILFDMIQNFNFHSIKAVILFDGMNSKDLLHEIRCKSMMCNDGKYMLRLLIEEAVINKMCGFSKLYERLKSLKISSAKKPTVLQIISSNYNTALENNINNTICKTEISNTDNIKQIIKYFDIFTSKKNRALFIINIADKEEYRIHNMHLKRISCKNPIQFKMVKNNGWHNVIYYTLYQLYTMFNVEQKMHLSEYFINPQSKAIDFALTAPLIYNNSLRGSVSFEMPISHLAKNLDALRTTPKNFNDKDFDYVFIVDIHGKLFYHPRQQWKKNSNTEYSKYTGDISLSLEIVERSLILKGKAIFLKMLKTNGSSTTSTFFTRNDMHSSVGIVHKKYNILKTYTAYKLGVLDLILVTVNHSSLHNKWKLSMDYIPSLGNLTFRKDLSSIASLRGEWFETCLMDGKLVMPDTLIYISNSVFIGKVFQHECRNDLCDGDNNKLILTTDFDNMDSNILKIILFYVYDKSFDNSVLKEKHDFIVRRWVCSSEEVNLIYPGSKIHPNHQCNSQQRYIESMANPKTIVFSKPEFDEKSKLTILSMSKAITINTTNEIKVIGMYSVSFHYNFLHRYILDDLSYCKKTGKSCYLLNLNGVLISHKFFFSLPKGSLPQYDIQFSELDCQLTEQLFQLKLAKRMECYDFENNRMYHYAELNEDINIHNEFGKYIETFERISITNLYLVITNKYAKVKSSCIDKDKKGILQRCTKDNLALPCYSIGNHLINLRHNVCKRKIKERKMFVSMDISNIEDCPSPACIGNNTALSCVSVRGCEWCKFDHKGLELDSPTCDQRIKCPFGYLKKPMQNDEFSAADHFWIVVYAVLIVAMAVMCFNFLCMTSKDVPLKYNLFNRYVNSMLGNRVSDFSNREIVDFNIRSYEEMLDSFQVEFEEIHSISAEQPPTTNRRLTLTEIADIVQVEYAKVKGSSKMFEDVSKEINNRKSSTGGNTMGIML